jgi:Mor family transcriptional regulator
MGWYEERNHAILAELVDGFTMETVCEHYRLSEGQVCKIVRHIAKTYTSKQTRAARKMLLQEQAQAQRKLDEINRKLERLNR